MLIDPASAALSIIVGLAGVFLLITLQSAREWGGKASKMHRSMVALGIEISLIAEALYDTGWHRADVGALYERRAVPRSVYDGLAHSGILSDLGPKTQELLYRFYWKASLGRYEDASGMIVEVTSAVAQAKRATAPGWPRVSLFFRPVHKRDGSAAGGSARGGGAGVDTAPTGGGAPIKRTP